MWGVTTHVYAPKSNTDRTTDLKKDPDTRSLAPSLLRILYIPDFSDYETVIVVKHTQ